MQTHINSPTIARGKHSNLARKVRDYLDDWYPTTSDDFDIDWSQVEVSVSGRMSRAYGKASWNKTTGQMKLKVSKHITDDWDRAMQTVRHEAIHIWQYQTHGKGDHGSTFKFWANKFGCSVHAPAPASNYKYHIVCENCGVIGGRHKRSKIVKHPDLYACSKCDGGQITSERV